MSNVEIPFTGVVIENSVDFIKTLFDLNHQKKAIMLLRSASDERQKDYEVEQVLTPNNLPGWAQLPFSPSTSNDIAQIAFTSGTEGIPKGILLSYRNQSDMVERLNSVMQIDHSIREYIGVPVYHSFGFGRCRIVSTVGGHFYIPPAGFDPLEIQAMLAAGEINSISAVPSLWRVLFEHAELFGDECLSLKWIEIGSQYMSAAEKRKLKALFPNAIIIQHYGLTEASRSTFLPIHKIDDEVLLESVGSAVGDTDIRCLDDGRIAIKGSLTAEYMIQSGDVCELLDEEGWFVTNDLGEISKGYLFYKGRADDMVNCGGVKVYAEAVEKALLERLGLTQGVVCARIKHDMRGEGLGIAYEKSLHVESERIMREAANVLSEMGVSSNGNVRLKEIETIPVTDTGKVKRKLVAQQFDLPASPATPLLEPPASESSKKHDLESHQVTRKERVAQLQVLWSTLLGGIEVSAEESFSDLGGDSLTSISAMLKMKKAGVPESIARGVIQGKTINQLVAQEFGDEIEEPRRNIDSSLPIKVVRGVLVLFVIFAHWSFGIFERLPESLGFLQTIAAPFFASGTPGFAVMYGVAIGFSFYPLYLQSPERLAKLISPILLLLGVGISSWALLRFGVGYIEGKPLTLTHFLNSFYSVLTYYFLATIMLRPLFYLIRYFDSPVITCCLLAVISHLLYVVVFMPLTLVPAEGMVEFLKLLVAAKYSFFNMMSGVLMGMAFGYALKRDPQAILTFRSSVGLSIALIIAAYLLSVLSGDSNQWLVWPTPTVPAWRWLFYLGVCIIAIFVIYKSLPVSNRFVKWLVEIFATIGLLAFPFYLSHEYVLPLKSLATHFGVPNFLALLVLVLIFIVGMSYFVIRSRKILFD